MDQKLLTTYIERGQQWNQDFDALVDALGVCFSRSETRLNAKIFLKNLFNDLPRKNSWQLSEAAGEKSPYDFQYLLDRAQWSHLKLRSIFRPYVRASLGQDELAFIFDDTGFIKQGSHSVGVKRQYTGTAGRIENCQIGVFLSYSTNLGATLYDGHIYIPEDWASDEDRRKETKIPDDIVYLSKTQIAQQMMHKALYEDHLKPAWTLMDSWYGRDDDFRMYLEEHRCPYVVGVPKNQNLFFKDELLSLEELTTRFPKESWISMSTGLGTKGEKTSQWIYIDLGCSEDGYRRAILIRYLPSKKDPYSYYRCFGTKDKTMQDFVRALGRRWNVEESFKHSKQEVGLDNYEVRSWHGWYRHITFAMVAHAFLIAMRAKELLLEALQPTEQLAHLDGQDSIPSCSDDLPGSFVCDDIDGHGIRLDSTHENTGVRAEVVSELTDEQNEKKKLPKGFLEQMPPSPPSFHAFKRLAASRSVKYMRN